jgi:hypothetical protein
LGNPQPDSEKKRRSRRRQIGDDEESVSVDGLLQPSNSAEDLEGAENQVIVAAVIRAGLAQANPPETFGRETVNVFTANSPLRSLLFSRQSISVYEASSSEPLTAQLFR